MPIATLTTKGQVTIPKRVREFLRVDTGDQIEFIVTDRGDVVVRGLNLDVRDIRGLVRRPGRSVTVDAMNAAIMRRHAKRR